MVFRSLALQVAIACLTISVVAARPVGRKLKADDCGSARVTCTARCGGNVSVFDCDEAGWFTDGQYYCQCRPTTPTTTPYSSDDSSTCFSGSSTVLTASGQRKRMADLELGDSVMAVGSNGKAGFYPVFLFTSNRPSQVATFARITTDAGLNITLTPSHYLFVHRTTGSVDATHLKSLDSWDYVLPSQVNKGDFVPVVKGQNGRMSSARVTNIELITDIGVFMPHTLTGAIVVDGVVASELTSVVPQWAAGRRLYHAMISTVRAVLTVLPRGWEQTVMRAAGQWSHGQNDVVGDRDVFLAGFTASKAAIAA